MKKKQVKKYVALTTASVMTMQLAACNTSESVTHEIIEEDYEIVEEINEDMIESSIEEIPVTEIENEYLTSVYDSQYAESCDEWDEMDDGSFECIDEDSDYYSKHFFEGVMFASLAAMAGSTIYKTYNSKNGTNKKRMKVNDLTNSNSGGGTSGSYSSSGSSNVKEKTPAVKPNTNTNSTGNATNSTNNSSTSNGSYSSSSNTNSYSNSSTNNNSSSYSNSSTNSSSSSSYSSGKSGFSSGGASRGGSSSS